MGEKRWFFFHPMPEKKENIKAPRKERWKIGLPAIGEKFFIVTLRIYYDEERLPREEFVIIEVKVTGYLRGNYTEIRTSDGKTPRYYKAKDWQKQLHKKWEDAVEQAERAADQYDRVWEKMEGKMRRGWRKKNDEMQNLAKEGNGQGRDSPDADEKERS